MAKCPRLAFSAGHRNCMGELLGMTEATVCLARRLANRWHLDLPATRRDSLTRPLVALGPPSTSSPAAVQPPPQAQAVPHPGWGTRTEPNRLFRCLACGHLLDVRDLVLDPEEAWTVSRDRSLGYTPKSLRRSRTALKGRSRRCTGALISLTV
ncbi:cytochrome P450 [Streptomyces sp. NPDC001581]|uniref:cytochrome P450 n=1 Tax=Streptomyces sp. NPDC001581 TaxID=3154386 RepID=UPI003326EEDB